MKTKPIAALEPGWRAQFRAILRAPAQIAELNQRNIDLQKEMADLRDDLESAQGEVKSLEDALDDFKEEHKDLPTYLELEKVGGDVEEVQEELGKLDSRVEDLEKIEQRVDDLENEKLENNIPELFDRLREEELKRLRAAPRMGTGAGA